MNHELEEKGTVVFYQIKEYSFIDVLFGKLPEATVTVSNSKKSINKLEEVTKLQ